MSLNGMTSPQFRRYKEDKEQLEELNSQLSTYIVRVRELQLRNEELERQIEVLTTRRLKSEGTVAEQLGAQLKDLQDQQAALLKQVAEGEFDVNALKKQLAAAQKEAAAKQKTLESAQAQLQDAEARAGRLDGEARAARSLVSDKNAEIKDLQKTIDDLRSQLSQSEAASKAAHLAQVEAEAKISNLTQQIDVQKSEFEEQISFAAKNALETSTSSASNDAVIAAVAEAKEHYKKAVDNFRKQIKAYFEQQPIILPDNAGVEARKQLESQVVEWRTKYEDYVHSVSTSQAEVAALKQRIATLQELLKDTQERHATVMASKEEYIYKLTKTIQEKDDLYRDLLDQSIALDTEIDYYRKLLNSEIHRLDTISSPARVVSSIMESAQAVSKQVVADKRTAATEQPVSRSTSSKRRSKARQAAQKLDLNSGSDGQAESGDGEAPAKKSKQQQKQTTSVEDELTIETNAQGSLAIEDVDFKNGNSIVVKNVSSSRLDITDWAITVTDEKSHLGTFVFEKASLNAGASITVRKAGSKGIKNRNVVWDEFPEIATLRNVSVYTFTPDDKESSMFVVTRQSSSS